MVTDFLYDPIYFMHFKTFWKKVYKRNYISVYLPQTAQKCLRRPNCRAFWWNLFNSLTELQPFSATFQLTKWCWKHPSSVSVKKLSHIWKVKKEDRGEVFSKDTIGYNKTLHPRTQRFPPLCLPDSPPCTCARISLSFFFNSIKRQTSQQFIPASFSCINFWQWETWLWAHNLGWICLLKRSTYMKSFQNTLHHENQINQGAWVQFCL